jgi:SAM-dependent methyltransferase
MPVRAGRAVGAPTLRKEVVEMGLVGRQFGNPQGLVGRVVGRFMARGNAAFNRWVVDTVAGGVATNPTRIVELGCGPGVGLETLLRVFPAAQVWGIDRSPVMIAQARRSNANAIRSGRLHLVQGEVSAVREVAPVDVAVGVHVLYFWHEPERELACVRAALSTGGRLALGYRLREDMPAPAQRQFPAEGHRLYETDDEVVALFRSAGFAEVELIVQEPASGRSRTGRVVIGAA